MAVKLHIKQIKAYKEVSVQVDGRTLMTKFGIKVYDADDLDSIRKEYSKLATNDTLELALAKLTKLEETGDKSSEEFYQTRQEYRLTVEEETQKQVAILNDFYRSQVLFITNAAVETEDGVSIKVDDTRTAKPVESLWESPEECLAVLLDTYFSVPSIRDSLSSSIVETVLNLQLDEKVKN